MDEPIEEAPFSTPLATVQEVVRGTDEAAVDLITDNLDALPSCRPFFCSVFFWGGYYNSPPPLRGHI